MTLVEKMKTQVVYLEGDGEKYRTEYDKGLKVYRKTAKGEESIPFTDNGFRSAMAYNGFEISKQEYLD